jgi:hypothetical protein
VKRHPLVALSVILVVLTAFVMIQCVEAQSTFEATSSSSSSSYSMKVSYRILGGGTPVAPTINYITTGGASASQTIPLSPNTITIVMGKNKPWSVTPNPLSPSSDSERWISSQTLSGKTPNSGGSTTQTFGFQHQYKLTVVSAYDTPTGTGWYNSGTTAYAQLSKTTVQDGSGTRHIFISWSGDASGTNQKSNPITMTLPRTATTNWKTQYQVTLNVNPAYAGTTTPSGTHYYDSSQSIQITANPSSNTFTAWTQTGTITIASPTSQTTTATINGPGTITANFATATQKPTYLTIQCTPATIGVNQVVIISGTLTDQYNHQLSGKTIILTYSPTASSLSWTGIGQATTGPDGSYQFTWTTNMPVGTYFVMAQFTGDQTYRCSSTVGSTDGTELTVVPEYAYGALAALSACFVGLFVFKKRSSLTISKQ